MEYICIAALLIGFIVAALLGPIFIPVLIKLKFGQSIREIGPKWHEKKSGTPTMGGIIFMVALAISAAVLYKFMDLKSALVLFCAFGFGIVGFLDDFIKVVLKRNLGLRAWQKLALQIIVSGLFVVPVHCVIFRKCFKQIHFIKCNGTAKTYCFTAYTVF